MKNNIVLFLFVAIIALSYAQVGKLPNGPGFFPPPAFFYQPSSQSNRWEPNSKIDNTIYKLPPPKNFTFTSGNFIVTVPVNGRVPKYYLTEKNSNFTYIFTFSNIIEKVNIKIKKIDIWIPVAQSLIRLKDLKWTVTNTTNSFTLRGTCPYKRFKAVNLINKFQSGSVNGVCLPSIKSKCVNDCATRCVNDGECIFGCEVGQDFTVDRCYSDCAGFNSRCLDSCLQTIDCIKRDCSTYLKIDLVLEDYRWVTPRFINNSRLTFTYDVEGRSTQNPVRVGNTLAFGNFWLQFNTSSFALPKPCTSCGVGACACNATTAVPSNINSTLDASTNKTAVQIYFSRFNSGYTLINDPRIGISAPWFNSNSRAIAPMSSYSSSSIVYCSFVLLAILLSFATNF